MKKNMLGNSIGIGKFFLKNKIPFFPNLIRLINRLIFSCDIHMSTEIDESVRFSHNGLGVVINSNAIIKKNVLILHEVTLGGNFGKKKEIEGIVTSAPVIGRNVVIGAGAKILGPVKIGDYSIIGAGSIVTKDIPQKVIVAGNPAVIIRELNEEDIKNLII